MSKKKEKEKQDMDYTPKSPSEVKELMKRLSQKTNHKQFQNTADRLRGIQER